jgi:6-phosphogluconate dehydrogenase
MILMIKEAVDEIDKKFEELKNTIRKKNIIIEELNTKLMKNNVE